MTRACSLVMNKIRSLRDDQHGTSLIELAILAPFAALLLLGMVDTSLAFTKKLRIEQVVQRAVEKATAYGSAGSDYSGLDDEAAAAANVPLKDVKMDKWLECSGERQEDFDDECDEDELISRHVSMTIKASYTPMFRYGPIGKLVGAQETGVIPFTVDSEVRIQ